MYKESGFLQLPVDKNGKFCYNIGKFRDHLRGASNPTTPTANDHTEVCMLSAGQCNWSNEQQSVVAEAITSGEHRIMIPVRSAYTTLDRIMKRISRRTSVSQRCYAHDAERQPMLSISKSNLEREIRKPCQTH